MAKRRSGFLNTLSGRFLLLTVAFVMLAEVLIFVPSIARFREDYLLLRLEKAQIASLALLATDGLISAELDDTRSLLEKGLAQAPRVRALEREAARLDGELGELKATRARGLTQKTEIGINKLRINAERRETARR